MTEEQRVEATLEILVTILTRLEVDADPDAVLIAGSSGGERVLSLRSEPGWPLPDALRAGRALQRLRTRRPSRAHAPGDRRTLRSRVLSAPPSGGRAGGGRATRPEPEPGDRRKGAELPDPLRARVWPIRNDALPNDARAARSDVGPGRTPPRTVRGHGRTSSQDRGAAALHAGAGNRRAFWGARRIHATALRPVGGGSPSDRRCLRRPGRGRPRDSDRRQDPELQRVPPLSPTDRERVSEREIRGARPQPQTMWCGHWFACSSTRASQIEAPRI